MSIQGRRIFDTRNIIAFSIILAGVLLLLQNYGLIAAGNLWAWWPVILIFMGLGHILEKGSKKSMVNGSILILIGVMILDNNLDLFHIRWEHLWPILLILFGILILTHHSWHREQNKFNEDFIDISSFLGGGRHQVGSTKLTGGKVSTVMGGMTLDLRQADMQGSSMVLDLFSLMGGIDIFIPGSWDVIMQGMPILGSMENKTFSHESGTAGQTRKQLIIKGLVILGGVEVKN